MVRVTLGTDLLTSLYGFLIRHLAVEGERLCCRSATRPSTQPHVAYAWRTFAF